MKTTIVNVLLISSIFSLFFSCGDSSSTRSGSSRDEQVASINELEQKLRAQQDVTLDTVSANALVQQSMDFVTAHPSDSLSGDILFKAADVSRGLGHYEQAIEMWDRFAREYPRHEKVPVSLFLKAFTADKDLEDVGMATTYYERFLQKYPDHPQARDARMLLDILQSDQSPEELIKQFEKDAAEEEE